MLLGNIIGKSGTNDFIFLVNDNAKKFMYVKAMHKEGYPVLAQIVEVEKEKEETRAKCNILGYRDKSLILRNLRTPLEPGLEVEYADDEFVRNVLDLKDNKTGAYVGVLEDRENVKVYLDLNKLITKHVSVLAKSGSGKSYCVSTILEEVLEKKIPIVVIDPHGEYSSLKFPSDKKEELKIFGLEPKGYIKQIQEYSPDVEKNPEAKVLKLSSKSLTGNELMHLLPAKLSSSQIGLLYGALSDTTRASDFDQLMLSLQAEENNAKWTLISVIDYLKKLNIFSDNPTNIGEIVNVGKCSVINLRGIPQELQEIIVYKLLNDLFNARKRGEIPPFFLVLEECHNYCLTGDTNILTSKGNKLISEISDKDLITTFNFKTGEVEYNNVKKRFNPRKSEVYELITTFGNKIKATKDHPFYTKSGFVYVSGLNKISVPLQSVYKISKDLVTARLMGHLLGDGWLTKNGNRSGTAGFSGRKEDLIKIKKDLIFLGFSSSNFNKADSSSLINSIDGGLLEVNGTGYSMASSTRCFNYFKNYDLPIGRRVLQKYFIPQFIMNGSLEVKSEFLGALMGSDGGKLRIKNKNSDVVRVSFSKIESLEDNAEKYTSQLIQLFNELGINAKYWIRNGNIRKTDGLKTKKYIIDISNKNDNFYQFISKVGFRYHSEKEELTKKAIYYYKHKLNIISKNEELRNMVLDLRAKTSQGKIRLAKHFGLSPNLVKTWIYDFKDCKRSKSAGLGRMHFPSFDEWCKKYSDKLFIYDPILSIYSAGEEYVYNFSIDNENFIANDILVHNCPERSFGEAKSSGIIRQILAEGRKFGLGVAVITQRPSRVEKSVLSQCTTQIILKITNPNDLKSISSSVEGITSETEKEIINLHIGTAMIIGVADMPLFVNVRPRRTKHGGESIDVVGTFSDAKIDESYDGTILTTGGFGLETSKNWNTGTKEVVSMIRPKLTKNDIKQLVNKPIRNLKAIMIPCSMIACVKDKQEFNLLVNLNNGHVVNDIERAIGKELSFSLDKLSEKEARVLGVCVTLNKPELTTAEIFPKSGLQFSEVFDILNGLIKKGFLIKIDKIYSLTESMGAMLNLKSLSCFEKNEFIPFEFDNKLETKYKLDNVLGLLRKFVEVKSFKDCNLVKYDVEY